MLLTISTTYQPATDLGFLLRKNPARVQSFNLSFGRANIFYSEATNDRCTCALQVDVDPVGLVRRRRGPAGEGGALEQYVNDRPYAASSFLSVAIANVFDAALGGRCKEKPELADLAIPLRATISAVPCRGGAEMVRRLFEPLGYSISAEGSALDQQFQDWGQSPYYKIQLEALIPLHLLLSHLYVLLPVLDNGKHYWVGDDEVAKLLRHGEGWLSTHPERTVITSRYLRYRRSLIDDALDQLSDDTVPEAEEPKDANLVEEVAAERTLNLNEQRLAAVLSALRSTGAKSVIDLGCGEGRLIKMLLHDRQFERITGMDVCHRSLQIASERLRIERLPEAQKQRITLIHGSLMYKDERFGGFDAASVVEVIEHLDPPRLAAFERVLFEFAKPGYVVITTPNAEYNVMWPSLTAGCFRHRDHRFEWTRTEFQAWANRVATLHNYQVQFQPVGPEDSNVGSPTQMAIFRK